MLILSGRSPVVFTPNIMVAGVLGWGVGGIVGLILGIRSTERSLPILSVKSVRFVVLVLTAVLAG